jgi:hypothetical protein
MSRCHGNWVYAMYTRSYNFTDSFWNLSLSSNERLPKSYHLRAFSSPKSHYKLLWSSSVFLTEYVKSCIPSLYSMTFYITFELSISVAPEPDGSSPYSQEPSTGPYPEPTGSNLPFGTIRRYCPCTINSLIYFKFNSETRTETLNSVTEHEVHKSYGYDLGIWRLSYYNANLTFKC